MGCCCYTRHAADTLPTALMLMRIGTRPRCTRARVPRNSDIIYLFDLPETRASKSLFLIPHRIHRVRNMRLSFEWFVCVVKRWSIWAHHGTWERTRDAMGCVCCARALRMIDAASECINMRYMHRGNIPLQFILYDMQMHSNGSIRGEYLHASRTGALAQ